MSIKNEDERKDAQVGFRITRAQKRRLDAVIQRIQSKDKRVEVTEIYTELMSLTEPELITEEDRDYLSGHITTLQNGSDPFVGEKEIKPLRLPKDQRKVAH